MEQKELKRLLEEVAAGKTDIDSAMLKLKVQPFEDLGFAKIDHHRGIRQGAAEVIYGAGKTPEQIAEIAGHLYSVGQKTVLITRMSAEAAEIVGDKLPLSYHEIARIGIVGEMPQPDTDSTIVIASGGTSDMPVAEEAALTTQALGSRVTRLYDVGVAGLHRLLAHTEDIMTAKVIVVIAGMEGALASVIGGLRTVPLSPFPQASVTERHSADCPRFFPCSIPARAE